MPTKPLLDEFYRNVISMSTHSYDINELMSLSINAISSHQNAVYEIANIGGQYQRLAAIGQVNEFNNDMEILSRAWIEFTTKLFAMVDKANLWDERGRLNAYYAGLLNDDIVLRLFPRNYSG